jgi:hypothetical protein
LTSTTLSLLSRLATAVSVALLVGLLVAVAWLGWSVGRAQRARGYTRT